MAKINICFIQFNIHSKISKNSALNPTQPLGQNGANKKTPAEFHRIRLTAHNCLIKHPHPIPAQFFTGNTRRKKINLIQEKSMGRHGVASSAGRTGNQEMIEEEEGDLLSCQSRDNVLDRTQLTLQLQISLIQVSSILQSYDDMPPVVISMLHQLL